MQAYVRDCGDLESLIGSIPSLGKHRQGFNNLLDFFVALHGTLAPSCVCEVGAAEATFSRQVRDLLAGARIVAFEANPNAHAHHAPSLRSKDIEYMNLAASDRDGTATIFAPTDLSKAYSEGKIIERKSKEGDLSGKTSLRQRAEKASYNEYEVESVRLDTYFAPCLDQDNVNFTLFLDCEGAADLVIAGANYVLKKTYMVFLEVEGSQFWECQKSLAEMLAQLDRHGFIPLLRDEEYDDFQFNIIFVNKTIVQDLSFILGNTLPISVKDPTRYAGMNLSRIVCWLQSTIPIYIPCFNNPTYTQQMVAALQDYGFQKIILIDNNSSIETMEKLFTELGSQVEILRLDNNVGPHFYFKTPELLALLPERFCITDPDIKFNQFLPPDFLGTLAGLLSKHKVGKAGFALDISDRHLMIDSNFNIAGSSYKIWEWEAQFWEHRLDSLDSGDRVYAADIDTTFALYEKRFFEIDKHTRAVRVAGRYTAKHLPWYKKAHIPEIEEEAYRNTQAYSYYMRPSSTY